MQPHAVRERAKRRTLIVDDEIMGRNVLRHLLAAVHEVEIVDEAASVPEARLKIESLRPDLVFMDIEMPGGSGIDALEGLEAPPLRDLRDGARRVRAAGLRTRRPSTTC